MDDQSNSQGLPLPPEQAEQLRRLGQSLTADQLLWASGYLAGLQAANQEAPAAPATTAAEPAARPRLTILYGSQTGNCEQVAEQARARALEKGFEAELRDMGDYKKAHFQNDRHLLVVVSTQGEGDPPDTAEELHTLLSGRKAPKLQDTKFSVLSLGDSSYENFCQTGKDFDARLEALGATRIHPRVDCDVDYDDAAEAWIDGVLAAYEAEIQPAAPVGQPQAASVSAPVSIYSKKNPFAALILENINLCGQGSFKEVRHIELSLEESGLNYEPGDAVGVVPVNRPELVSELVEALELDGDASVPTPNGELALQEALSRNYEITTVTPGFLKQYAAVAESAELTSLLEEDRRADLRELLAGRDILDIVQRFPVRGLNPAEFVDMLRKLPPRLYSIASSPLANPDEVHLTVAAVRYHSHGRDRYGVASTWLADRLGEDDTVPVYIDANPNFRLPADPNTPMIMIGPGTGVAPFRAFLEQREATGAQGRNWLFFGNPHFTTDFLYQREWLAHRKSGLLTRLDVAFSRDTDRKIYVQDRVRERAREVYAWLQEGAYLYVCGDANGMAPDVHQALIDVVQNEGGLSTEQAAEYVKQLQKDKRYQRDVY